jgi:hypothetical protein
MKKGRKKWRKIEAKIGKGEGSVESRLDSTKGCNRAIPRIWATQKMAIFKGESIAYEAHIETALDWE